MKLQYGNQMKKYDKEDREAWGGVEEAVIELQGME